MQTAAQAEVFERTLANGLKSHRQGDHRAPVVVQQIWYKAGSMDERTGVSGIAHVLEHLMSRAQIPCRGAIYQAHLSAAGGREKRLYQL